MYDETIYPVDHFYTTSEPEMQKAKTYGYVLENMNMYCVMTAGECGASRPLHRFVFYLLVHFIHFNEILTPE